MRYLAVAYDFHTMRERWEGLETRTQAAISFPFFLVFLFLMNLGPFAQPLVRSIVYGIIEGAAFTGLLLVATATERSRRENRDADITRPENGDR